MSRAVAAVALAWFAVTAVAVAPLAAQSRPAKRAPARKAAPAKPIVARPNVTCPAALGEGAATHRDFCDVLVGRDPLTGIIVNFPPHRGGVVLTFDLHNRQTYSPELVREKRAYTQHTATIGVLTPDGALLTRAVVETQFRGPEDLLDRITGGAGPSGIKAIAPVGDEPIEVNIPEGVESVSVLGEKLVSTTADGTETVTAAGRPIAIVSNLQIQYLPPLPAKKKAPAKKVPRKK